MARVTVEDCVTIIPNRFELCLVANNRAKSILAGAGTSLDGTEKPSVIALREIAEGLVDVDQVRKNITESTKNRNSEIINEHVAKEATQAIVDEAENTVSLKDNIFLEDNLNVED